MSAQTTTPGRSRNTSLTRSPPNSNPYGVYGVGAGAYIADAGTNVLDFVTANGDRSIISGIPLPRRGRLSRRRRADVRDDRPREPVRGRPLAGGCGSVTAASRRRSAGRRRSGANLIHHVTGCAADDDGNIYLVDMWGVPGPPIPAGPASVANTGSVVELRKDGSAVVASRARLPERDRDREGRHRST